MNLTTFESESWYHEAFEEEMRSLGMENQIEEIIPDNTLPTIASFVILVEHHELTKLELEKLKEQKEDFITNRLGPSDTESMGVNRHTCEADN